MPINDIEIDYNEFEFRFNIPIPQIPAQRTFVLYGNSRSGKSSLYCAMTHQVRFNSVRDCSSWILVPGQAKLKAIMDSTHESVTELPNRKHHKDYQNVLVVDCPGLLDNSKVRELINFHYICEVLKGVKKIHFAVVLLLDQNKQGYFLPENELKMLQRFMKTFPGCQKCVSIIVNKVKVYKKEDMHKIREQINKDLRKNLDAIDKEYAGVKEFFFQALNKVFIAFTPISQEEEYKFDINIIDLPNIQAFYQEFKGQLSPPQIIEDENVEHRMKMQLNSKVQEFTRNVNNQITAACDSILNHMNACCSFLQTSKDFTKYQEESFFQQSLQKQFNYIMKIKQAKKQKQLEFLKQRQIEMPNQKKSNKLKKQFSKDAKKEQKMLAKEVSSKLQVNLLRFSLLLEDEEHAKIEEGENLVGKLMLKKMKIIKILLNIFLLTTNKRQIELVECMESFIDRKFEEVKFFMNTLPFLITKDNCENKQQKKHDGYSSFYDQVNQNITRFNQVSNKISIIIKSIFEQEKKKAFQWNLAKEKYEELSLFYTEMNEYQAQFKMKQTNIAIKLKQIKLCLFFKKDVQISQFITLFYAIDVNDIETKVMAIQKLGNYYFNNKHYFLALQLFELIHLNLKIKECLLALIQQQNEQLTKAIHQNIQSLADRGKIHDAIEICQKWIEVDLCDFQKVIKLKLKIAEISIYSNSLAEENLQKIKKINNLKDLYGPLLAQTVENILQNHKHENPEVQMRNMRKEESIISPSKPKLSIK